MDFMHPSDDLAHPIIYAPYLGMPYGGAAFDDFPELHGYNRLVVLDGYFKDLQPSGISAFIQAWLYLGLLIEVLNEGLGFHEHEGAQLKTEDLVCVRGGEKVLDTTGLASYLTSWYERAESLSSDEIARSRDRVAHFIRTARAFASKALTPEASQAEDFPFQPEIQSSIVVLGSLLDQHASMVYGTRTENWPQSLVALQRLSGSCPNDLAWLISQFASEVIYFRSTLSWPKDGRDHSRCDRHVCVADQIDPNKYSTLHTTGECDCVWVAISEDELLAVLENGGVPLLVPPSLDGGIVEWKIVSNSACPEMSYVAISHVWSGGLGNPTKNSLPLCQLEKIRQYVAELFQGEIPLVWIDTLCVPQRKHGRKLAISKMKETYQDAARVLVLDTQLMHTPINPQRWQSSGTDDARVGFAKEFLLRIALSGWMRRLWTFQEGAIARELDFQFANGSLNLRQLLLAIKGDRTALTRQVVSSVMILRALAYPLDRELQLVHLLGALRWRSTSHAKDEAVCIATLLELPAEVFLDLPLEKQMPHLLTAIGSVPTSLLFSHGPRLNVPNFSWAPQSFLNSHDILDLGNARDGFGLCSGSGFTAKLPGWVITQQGVTPPSGKFWWIQETLPDGRLMQVVRSQQSTKQLADWHPSDIVLGSETRIGFVVKPTIQTLLPTGTTEFFKGLCVAIMAESEGVFSVRIICLVVVMTCDYAELLTDIEIEPVDAELLGRDQMWCFT
jgi:hypothetical protein